MVQQQLQSIKLVSGTHYVTVTDATGASVQGFINVEPEVPCGGLALRTKIYLQETYDDNIGLMNDYLRLSGSLPLTSPSDPTITASSVALLTTGEDAIVDWVFVELRDPNTPTTVLAETSGLIKRNGEIVGADGLSDLFFEGLDVGDYYVAIHHRNHIAVMSATPVSLDRTANIIVDFTSGNAYGLEPMHEFANGTTALYSGDTNADGAVNAADRANAWNDRNQSGLSRFRL